MGGLQVFFWQEVDHLLFKKIVNNLRSPIFLLYALTIVFYAIYGLYIHPPWQDIHIEGYIDRAVSMANGATLGSWDTFYPVGMTYLLAPFFYFFNYDLALRIIVIFYAFLLATANYITFRTILDFYKTKSGAWFALIFCSVYYPFIAYLGFYISEIPFIFMLVLSLYLFCRAFYLKEAYISRALLAGLILGFAAIVRGTLFPAFILLIILLIIKRMAVSKMILFFALGFLFVIAIQSIRNSFVLGKFVPFSTNGGVNTYLGQAHLKKVSGTPNYGGWYWYNTNCAWDTTLTREETFNFNGWDEKLFYDRVRLLWKENFKKQMALSVQNGIEIFYLVDNHWFVFNSSISSNLSHKYQWAFVILIYIPLIIITLSMVKNKKNKFLNLIFIIPIISVILMAMVTKGEERYLVPFQYLMIILVAPFWAGIIDKIKRFKSRSIEMKSFYKSFIIR